MYLCNNCGEQFEAPATYIEAYTDGGNAVASGYVGCCPACGART